MLPHYVRAAKRVAMAILKNGTADAERRAHQNRHRHARQSPLGDHQGDIARRTAKQRVKNLREIERDRAAAQAPDRQHQNDDGQQRHAGD